MNPAFSVVVFTTLAGAAQGLLAGLAIAGLSGVELSFHLLSSCLSVGLAMLVAGLAASFLHLGRPERAWRAAMMWRTSWLSREVIVLPAFIGLVALWFALVLWGEPSVLRDRVLPLAVLVMALLLWYCTAMIYVCIRFIQEWAHPLTVANYLLIGMSSGLILLTAMAWLTGSDELLPAAAIWALATTVLAALVRMSSIRRNDRLVPRSTMQSALGVPNARLSQQSMGMTAGSYNTREFMHGQTMALIARIRLISIALGFVVPIVMVLIGIASGAGGWLVAAVPVQYAGLLAERWFFFAQARHPQNLYYQVVS